MTKVNGKYWDSDNEEWKNTYENRDKFEIYEAWAWHRGDYFNFKVGRWSNTTRFGSQTFGGYTDSKKDNNNDDSKTSEGITKSSKSRAAGFMSTYDPENSVQFGFHNVAEDISLDLSFISMDNHLNKGDLRVNVRFDDIAGKNGLNASLGYRSNVFDEIYSKYGDVTHTVALGGSVPLVADVGFLKNMNLFLEAAVIGLDDQSGTATTDSTVTIIDPTYCPATKDGFVQSSGCRSDKGKAFTSSKPILAGLELNLYRSFDKVVFEVEYDGNRGYKPQSKDEKKNGKKLEKATPIAGSIFVKKQLNDRFTLNLGMQSENNSKDFSFAGRLQGRIN